MSWFNCLVGSMAVLLTAGCAVTPDEATVGLSDAETAVAIAAQAASAPADEAAGARENLDPAIVDLQHLAQSEPVICREMLKPASNVIVTYCGTPAAWKVFKRQQEQWSQQMLRMMQGSPYR
jgi:hypothetical protein